MAEKKAKTLYLYKVRHPDHCQAPVVAENAEQATVQAAKLWGVPWGRVVFYCDVAREGEILPHVCPRCRKYNAYNDRVYCARCQAEIDHEEERLKAARQAYFRKEARESKKGEAV